jgi:hypothetical protein
MARLYHRYQALCLGCRVLLRDPSILVLPRSSGEVGNCPIPDVCIDERRLPLFIARATLRELIAMLQARATGETAR